MCPTVHFLLILLAFFSSSSMVVCYNHPEEEQKQAQGQQGFGKLKFRSTEDSKKRSFSSSSYSNSPAASFVQEFIHPLKNHYQQFSPKAKFMTGAAVGFASSKLIVGTTVKLIKVVGTAYLVSEVLQLAGFLDTADFIQIPPEGQEFMVKIRQDVVQKVKQGRESIQRRLNWKECHSTLKCCMEKDKMATLGFMTGATAGFVW